MKINLLNYSARCQNFTNNESWNELFELWVKDFGNFWFFVNFSYFEFSLSVKEKGEKIKISLRKIQGVNHKIFFLNLTRIKKILLGFKNLTGI